MQGFCIICTEVFSGNSDVSATRCGHVFHAICLTRWLNEKRTCPQCRKGLPKDSEIISKLYFASPDSVDSHESSFSNGTSHAAQEVAQLTTELERSRGRLTECSREITRLSAEKNSLQLKIDNLTESYRSLEGLHQRELDSNRLLRQQLTAAQCSARQATAAREEAAALKHKLTELQNVQMVINGCQEDIDTLIHETTDAKQLATWCAVYKAELARKRSECRALNESDRRTKHELELVVSKLSSQTTELAAANGKISSLEDDISVQNKEITSLKKKLGALSAALGSPGDTVAGLARRLVQESPAPSVLITPKLSTPSGPADDIDLDASADLFSPGRRSPLPPAKRPRQESAPSATSFRLSSAASKVPAAVVRDKTQGIVGHPLGVSNLGNPFAVKKVQLTGVSIPKSSSSVFREGYSGLGGHEKVVVPPARAANVKKIKQFLGPSKTTRTPKAPQLPTLLDFSSFCGDT